MTRRWVRVALGIGVFVLLSVALFKLRYLFSPAYTPLYRNFRLSTIPEGYAVHGIDVSHYQGRINWDKLGKINKRHTVSFVIMRATMGALGEDREFKRNWKATQKKNLIRGAYHYYNPNVNSTLQAENFILTVALEPGDLPPILDVEKLSSVQNLDGLRKGVRKWLEKVHQHYGVRPILYTGSSFYKAYLDGFFDDYPLWVANYNRVRNPVNASWIMWQHTETGTIDGIRGYVDFNVFNGSRNHLVKLSN